MAKRNNPFEDAVLAPGSQLRRKKKAEYFVMLPYERILRAAGGARLGVLAVLMELAYREFKRHKNPVQLPSAELEAVGIDRKAKQRALRQLEKAGLVEVTRCPRKSPSVKLLWK